MLRRVTRGGLHCQHSDDGYISVNVSVFEVTNISLNKELLHLWSVFSLHDDDNFKTTTDEAWLCSAELSIPPLSVVIGRSLSQRVMSLPVPVNLQHAGPEKTQQCNRTNTNKQKHVQQNCGRYAERLWIHKDKKIIISDKILSCTCLQQKMNQIKQREESTH